MSIERYVAPATIATVLTGSSLASATLSALSSEIDNSLTRARFAYIEVLADFDANPNAGEAVEIYIFPSLDGTNFSDGEVNSANYVCSIPVAPNSSAQRKVKQYPIEIPPLKFKYALYNSTGATLGTFSLKHRTTNKENV